MSFLPPKDGRIPADMLPGRGAPGGAKRRTTITGSPVETMAFRRLLAFIPDDMFDKVSVTGEELSMLVRYSWAIPIPPLGPVPPKEVVLPALTSPDMRQEYYHMMVGGYSFPVVENAIIRLLEQLKNLGFEDAN